MTHYIYTIYHYTPYSPELALAMWGTIALILLPFILIRAFEPLMPLIGDSEAAAIDHEIIIWSDEDENLEPRSEILRKLRRTRSLIRKIRRGNPNENQESLKRALILESRLEQALNNTYRAPAYSYTYYPVPAPIYYPTWGLGYSIIL